MPSGIPVRGFLFDQGSETMNAQLMQVYLFFLMVLNKIGTGAQAVVDAFNALADAVASKNPLKIADAISVLMKAIAAIIDKFGTTAEVEAHFSTHAAMHPNTIVGKVDAAEKEFHGIFGGLRGGGGGTTGGGAAGGGANLGGILSTIKNNLPFILSILKLFGVPVPTV